MRRLLFIVLVCLAVTGCGDYNKILKSTDEDFKYQKAVEYFNAKKYVKAQGLFDDIAMYYRGTERSQQILHYIAECYFGSKDYASAIDYYQTYLRSFPRGEYAEVSKYMIGYCNYRMSPDARLDQSTTHEAITNLQEFADMYPQSDSIQRADSLIDALFNKLAYKELLSARLYRNLGLYRGDNFQAAVIVSNNALNDYPFSPYREEFSFIILDSKYQRAKLSTADMQEERFRDAKDEYYSFINEYPSGAFRKAADKIFADIKKHLKE
ncbi:MAG TPA: outer membrane protein assembly factor BamD [Bacteroidales bacterium]|nr:outer membrane protein assembly factor BamD [Bacteroidales bacterium]